MKSFLYSIIELIYRAHESLLALNDSRGYFLTDKQLHFFVIGIIGMALIFLINPLFTLLAKRDHVMVISWIYVFTLMIVLTFAIEIGQKAGGTGNMEFADIVSGIFGFLLMFLVFAAIRGIIRVVIRLIRGEA